MNKVIFILFSIFFLYGSESNISSLKEQNRSDLNLTKDKLIQEAILKQIKREKKYKEEQKFYMGSEYNLDEQKVDKKTLKHIKAIEPEYDFDMDDVYND